MTCVLVYCSWAGRILPQKWWKESGDIIGGKRETLAEHELSAEEEAMPIAELIKRYPAPESAPE